MVPRGWQVRALARTSPWCRWAPAPRMRRMSRHGPVLPCCSAVFGCSPSGKFAPLCLCRTSSSSSGAISCCAVGPGCAMPAIAGGATIASHYAMRCDASICRSCFASLCREKTGFRPLFWPTVVAVPMLLLCLGLGTWQVQRLSWKEGLIAQRDAALAAAPVARAARGAEARGTNSARSRGGEFLNDREIYLGATSLRGDQGYHIVTPLREPRADRAGRSRLRPGRAPDPAKRAAGEIAGTVTGLAAVPPEGRPSWFLPATGRTRTTGSGSTCRRWPRPTVGPGGAVLYRRRRRAQSGRLAARRRHSRAAEQSPAICDHLVFPGGCGDRHLCPCPAHARRMTAYRELEARFRRLGAVEEAIAVLHWDAAAMMPRWRRRGARRAARDVAPHRAPVADRTRNRRPVAEAEAEGNSLDPWQGANLREMRRRWRHAAAVPDDLVEAVASLLGIRGGVARGAPGERFRRRAAGAGARAALTREVAAAKAEAARHQPLRRAARPVRARRSWRRSTACSPRSPGSCPA